MINPFNIDLSKIDTITPKYKPINAVILFAAGAALDFLSSYFINFKYIKNEENRRK